MSRPASPLRAPAPQPLPAPSYGRPVTAVPAFLLAFACRWPTVRHPCTWFGDEGLTMPTRLQDIAGGPGHHGPNVSGDQEVAR